MSDLSRGIDRLFDLADAVCDGDASEQDLIELNAILLADPRCRYEYLDYCRMHTTLKLRLRARRALQNAHLEIDAGSSVAAMTPKATPLQSPFAIVCDDRSTTRHGEGGFFASDWPVAYLASTLICGLGILILAFIPVHHHVPVARESTSGASSASPLSSPVSPLPSSLVGRITGTVDCQWERKGLRIGDRGLGKDRKGTNQKSEIRNQKNLVAVGDSYALSAGLMEITYDTGAKVILQGPCTYQVESAAGGYLFVGKLTARVEKGSRSKVQGPISAVSSPQPPALSPSSNPSLSTTHYPLFTIKTPTATVTDLGTEFGVDVDKAGRTTSHVFRGSVRLEAGEKTEAVACILTKGESACVEIDRGNDNATPVLRQVAADPQVFVRRLLPPPKVIDLLDIVAGGNGAGRHRERGIDPCTGMEDPMFQGTLRVSDQTYHRATYFPMIDGVFMPDGSQGPVEIDSAGHRFGFPKTEGRSVGPIWTRAVNVRPKTRAEKPDIWIYEDDFAEPFMPERRGLLALHANVGITFDLEAIRQAHGGRHYGRFRATAGKRWESLADLWVFVDGTLQWKALQIVASSGVSRVEVPIRPVDRFLTLVATDGGNGIGGDQGVFGDPVLESLDLETK